MDKDLLIDLMLVNTDLTMDEILQMDLWEMRSALGLD